jgi:hypothetical protein
MDAVDEAVVEQQQRDLKKYQRLRLKHAQALAAEAFSGAGLLNEAQAVSVLHVHVKLSAYSHMHMCVNRLDKRETGASS